MGDEGKVLEMKGEAVFPSLLVNRTVNVTRKSMFSLFSVNTVVLGGWDYG